MCGKIPSSSPVRNTTGNSRPFALCSVISVTIESSAPSPSMSVTSEIASRNACTRASPLGGSGHLVDARDRDERGGVAGVQVLVELPRDTDELGQVLDAALRLDRALGLELGEVAGLGRGSPSSAPDDPAGCRVASSSSITSSRSRIPPSALPVTPGRGTVAHRLAERDARALRVRLDLAHARVADAALRAR